MRAHLDAYSALFAIALLGCAIGLLLVVANPLR
jgi:hypothetical protein